MFEINPSILAIQCLTFVVGMAFIWWIYLKPLGRHLKDRQERISKAIQDSQAAREEADRLKAQTAKDMDDLRDKQRLAQEEARAEAGRLREQLMEQARAEQARMLQAARRQIEQETEEAMRQVRAQAADLVVKASSKLLARNLNQKTQGALALKFIKEMEKKKLGAPRA